MGFLSLPVLLPRHSAFNISACPGHAINDFEINPKSINPMITILLLTFSNIFMTFAWYGHLKYGHAWPLWKAILVSWAIALLEYCLAVPANRLGYARFSGFQLKFIQEAVTLVVFIVFATTFLKEKLAWNYLAAIVFLGLAAFFAFAFRTTGSGC
jgi:uncharacterized protein (DUF486 family)